MDLSIFLPEELFKEFLGSIRKTFSDLDVCFIGVCFQRQIRQNLALNNLVSIWYYMLIKNNKFLTELGNWTSIFRESVASLLIISENLSVLKLPYTSKIFLKVALLFAAFQNKLLNFIISI